MSTIDLQCDILHSVIYLHTSLLMYKCLFTVYLSEGHRPFVVLIGPRAIIGEHDMTSSLLSEAPFGGRDFRALGAVAV